jgi:hypothetical protein
MSVNSRYLNRTGTNIYSFISETYSIDESNPIQIEFVAKSEQYGREVRSGSATMSLPSTHPSTGLFSSEAALIGLLPSGWRS